MDVDLDRPPEDDQMDYEPEHTLLTTHQLEDIAISPGGEKMEEEMIEYTEPHLHGDVEGDEMMEDGDVDTVGGEEAGMEAEPTPPIQSHSEPFLFSTSAETSVVPDTIPVDEGGVSLPKGRDMAEVENLIQSPPSTLIPSESEVALPQTAPSFSADNIMPTLTPLPLPGALLHSAFVPPEPPIPSV